MGSCPANTKRRCGRSEDLLLLHGLGEDCVPLTSRDTREESKRA